MLVHGIDMVQVYMMTYLQGRKENPTVILCRVQDSGEECCQAFDISQYRESSGL